MKSLMMDYPLTIPALLRRTERLFGDREVVSREADGSIHRTTYAECLARAAGLSLALERLGLRPGDRVATLCWNHHRHLEAYFAIPSAGMVLHTLNLRLPREELAYTIAHAGDRAVIVDEELLPLLLESKVGGSVDHVIVVGSRHRSGPRHGGTLDYEVLLGESCGSAWVGPEVAEAAPAAMCYTSGTTGKPKGVVYSHKALVVHSLCSALPDVFGLSEADTVLSIVPMFHANAWGLPYTAALVGARQVLPGPHPDSAIVLDLIDGERVTFTAAVPTVWLSALQHMEPHPGRHNLRSLRCLIVGGGACPEWLIRAFQDRFGVKVVHSWGMTELTPVGTISRPRPGLQESDVDAAYRSRARQGRPMPLVEIRARNEDGLVPWDASTMGELEVRGPAIASAYYATEESRGSFTEDGWFRTGDIVTIDAGGSIEICDRAKDLIKSGGEWISSVILEGALMGHPDVAEAAVIAVPHPTWQERPLAVVVRTPGQLATAESLTGYLAERFPAWYLPDAIVFVEAIPRTGTGKVKKAELRERFQDSLKETGINSGE